MPANGLPAARQNLAAFRAQISSFKAAAPRVRGEGAYLMFSKGDWTFGRDRAPFDLDSTWIVHPSSLQHGYICWRNGVLKHELLQSFTQPLPPETELPPAPVPDPGSDDQPGYQLQYGFTCVCTEGPQKGQQLTFKSASVGGRSAILKLIDDIDARIEDCEATGDERFFPVVRFGTDSYIHKTRGKIWTPEIEVVGFGLNDPDVEIDWLEEEEVAPPPPPTKTVRMRRVAK